VVAHASNQANEEKDSKFEASLSFTLTEEKKKLVI
jgi:hypothetical protein